MKINKKAFYFVKKSGCKFLNKFEFVILCKRKGKNYETRRRE